MYKTFYEQKFILSNTCKVNIKSRNILINIG